MELAVVNQHRITVMDNITLSEITWTILNERFGGTRTAVFERTEHVLCLMYATQKICMLAREELYDQTVALLLKAHVIAGWKLPEGAMLDMLIEQTQKCVLEDYKGLTVHEIEYALRHYGRKLPYYGSNCNLQLIFDSVDQYLELKRQVNQYQYRALEKIYEQRIAGQATRDYFLENGRNGAEKKD